MKNSAAATDYDQLIEQLYEPETRRAARQKLVREGAVEPLLGCLKKREESVVWAAVKSLGDLRAEEAVEPLIGLLEHGVLLLDVCEALTAITGQYFGSNPERWREWLNSSKKAAKSRESVPGLYVAECIRATGEYLGVKPTGSGKSFRFKLSLPDGRTQRVAVFFGHKDAKGEGLVVIYSECGPAKAKLYETVLRKNMGIPAGAFAVRDIKGQPHFVIVDTMVAASVTPDTLAKKIDHIGSWADMAEKDLTKEDRR
jgi:hypothetical protein